MKNNISKSDSFTKLLKVAIDLNLVTALDSNNNKIESSCISSLKPHEKLTCSLTNKGAWILHEYEFGIDECVHTLFSTIQEYNNNNENNNINMGYNDLCNYISFLKFIIKGFCKQPKETVYKQMGELDYVL